MACGGAGVVSGWLVEMSGPSERDRTTHMRQIRRENLSVALILPDGIQIDRARAPEFSVSIESAE